MVIGVKFHTAYTSYLQGLNKKPAKINAIKSISEAINSSLGYLQLQLNEPRKYYANLFITNIENELKDNFQISTLNDLIRFEEEKIEIKYEKLYFSDL